MKKIIIFFFLIFTVYMLKGNTVIDGPYFTYPEPTHCKQTRKIQCSATACAMVLVYWEMLGVVNHGGCNYYMNEFLKLFEIKGTAPAYPFVFENALRSIMWINLLGKTNVNKNVETKSFTFLEYKGNKENITYSTKNEEISPWDRPGVLVYLYRGFNRFRQRVFKGHALLMWGCKKEKIRRITYIKYKYKNPWYNENTRSGTWFKIKVLPRFEIKQGFIVYCWPIKCKVN